jgi:hypothetical protein
MAQTTKLVCAIAERQISALDFSGVDLVLIDAGPGRTRPGSYIRGRI